MRWSNFRATGNVCPRRRAVAAVEFALVAPILFMLVLGSIEFGRAMTALNLLSNAARNGARVGVLPNTSNTDVTNAVTAMLNDTVIGSSSATITIQVNGATADVSTAMNGDIISVTVSVPDSAVNWLVAPLFLGSYSFSQTSVMRHQ